MCIAVFEVFHEYIMYYRQAPGQAQVFITKTGRKWHRHNDRACLKKATAVWATSFADAARSGLTKCWCCG